MLDIFDFDETDTFDGLAEIPESASRTNTIGSTNSINSATIASTGKNNDYKITPSNFRPIKVLGIGSYGKVILVKERKTGHLYAQKQLKKASMIIEKGHIERTITEKSILESISHPFIVKLFYAIQDTEKIYLILEYVQGGELWQYLANQKMFSETTACFYLAEIALALHHLHTNVGIIYRDLKPENCLLDNYGHLLLTDFGLSKVSNGNNDLVCSSIIGTPEYMAPEILKGEKYSYEVDWWSFGAMGYDLMSGSPPFTGNNHKKVLDKIAKTKKLKFPYYFTNEAKDLLTRLLRKNPGKRLKTNDWEVIKNHRFFRKIDWEKLYNRDPSIIPPIIPVITDPILAENFNSQFTQMSISPAKDSIAHELGDNYGSPMNINNDGTGAGFQFKNFSYTASNSFIERSTQKFEYL